MIKNIVRVCLFFFFTSKISAQINIHTEDLPRFYAAFDSVLTTKDTIKQLAFIQQIYVDKASEGLKKFMELRGGNTQKWREYILTNVADLQQKRPWILSVLNQEKILKQKIDKFKKIYPKFREGDIYFCVGINNSGGTIFDNTVYIGAEIAANNKPDWAVALVLHEFTHTQQWVQRNILQLIANDSLVKVYNKTHTQLLGKCIEEGLADFVGELANGKKLEKIHPEGHTAFGLKNEKIIADLFKNDMFKAYNNNDGWLYNFNGKEINGKKISDLGYFMGYQICKTYYKKAKNKKLAIAKMLEMDYTDENVNQLLIESGYFSDIKPANN